MILSCSTCAKYMYIVQVYLRQEVWVADDDQQCLSSDDGGHQTPPTQLSNVPTYMLGNDNNELNPHDGSLHRSTV